jgi:hypothetical protein
VLNPRTLGFPPEDKVTAPHHKSPFGSGKTKAPVTDPTSTPPMTDHPANPHLKNALGAPDHAAKQKHVFKALSAIRKAAVTK